MFEHMKVHELIAALQKCDENADVEVILNCDSQYVTRLEEIKFEDGTSVVQLKTW